MIKPSSMQRTARSYSATVLKDTFRRWGAQVGLIWLIFLVCIAVFAPFIANSHPILVSDQGQLYSPLMSHLSFADVGILAAFFVSVLIFKIRLKIYYKFLIIISFSLFSALIFSVFSTPPALVVYEQYREQEAQAEYDWVIYAPIPYSPKDYLRDEGDTSFQSPLTDEARTHLFGTEENGADVLSRMVHASRIALAIGFIATGIAMLLGIILGGLMGFFSGIIDLIGMRLVEIFEAIPTLFLLLTFIAFFGRSLYIMMIIIGLTSWPGYARYIRAEFLRLRQQDFVQAAIASGLPLWSVLFRHMLPNGIAPVLVAASFGVASAILAEATLSFLGLGLVDDPSWGQMLNQAVRSSTFNWWMAVFPGGAIFLTVFAYNLVGEAMRDAIDPYLEKNG